jgi:hypothetical protein
MDQALKDQILALAAQHREAKEYRRARTGRCVRKESARVRISSCENKEQYTFPMAKLVAKRILRNNGDIVQPYKCRFCNHWHVGRSSVRGNRDERPNEN